MFCLTDAADMACCVIFADAILVVMISWKVHESFAKTWPPLTREVYQQTLEWHPNIHDLNHARYPDRAFSLLFFTVYFVTFILALSLKLPSSNT